MADKKLNAVDSATTVANFYGNNGGKDVQIPLATAASVLADFKSVYWKTLEKNSEISFVIERFACVIIIGHQYYGVGIYSLPQSSTEPIFIGGTDVRLINNISISIDNNTGMATIVNGDLSNVYYRFL